MAPLTTSLRGARTLRTLPRWRTRGWTPKTSTSSIRPPTASNAGHRSPLGTTTRLRMLPHIRWRARAPTGGETRDQGKDFLCRRLNNSHPSCPSVPSYNSVKSSGCRSPGDHRAVPKVLSIESSERRLRKVELFFPFTRLCSESLMILQRFLKFLLMFFTNLFSYITLLRANTINPLRFYRLVPNHP